ncbi:MAG: hypothetical protein AMJ81_14200 [Phycisphaerae bacterium SM23_33]|nr:MAG: hypothetical protein AMJ81_14200 [Phycisphaerae bacterium SM23_33]
MLLLLSVCCAVRAAGVSGIVIDTDRSVNSATVQTIVADVTAGCKTDRDKAVALYDFVVRTVWMPYVYGQPKEMIRGRLSSVRDPLKVLNVYGAAGCDIQADIFCTLAHAAGLKARRLDPGFAHGSNEIGWGGAWHWMDVWLPCYVTDETGRIYSYDELMADRSLIDKAAAAGRVSANFMFNPGPDIQAVKNAKNHRAGPAGSGVKKCQYHENLALRPGESCTWLWDHVGKWYWPGEKFACPAFKFAKDAACKQAFPYWEPYRKTIKNGPHPWSDTYYRYYGNAVFTHSVPMTKRGLAAWDAKASNIKDASGGVVAQDARRPAAIEIAFELPYVIADTQVQVASDPGGGKLLVDCSLDDGSTWQPPTTFGPGDPQDEFAIGKPNAREYPAGTTSGHYGFRLRVMLVGTAKLKSLRVTNTTMLNFYSRPWLEVGSNQVTVTCGDAAALAQTPLEVTWCWLEDWKTEKSFTHQVKKASDRCTIRVAGSKRPKMKSIAIACPAR